MAVKATDQRRWNDLLAKNDDPYESAVLRYAEDWANLMERGLSEGEELEDIARYCSYQVDTEGLTGFMFMLAVDMLIEFWEHGEQLAQWRTKTR